MAEAEDYSQWSSCEMYGHDFVADEDDPNLMYCRDCGESYKLNDGE